MINANELRVGNFIWAEDDFLFMTTEAEILSIDGREVFWKSVKDVNKDYTQEDLLVNIEGIPLAEDWLLKLGFKKDYDGCPTLLIGMQRFQCSRSEFIWQQTPMNDWSVFGIKYVHQLQNLFFALTGEELTVKQSAPA